MTPGVVRCVVVLGATALGLQVTAPVLEVRVNTEVVQGQPVVLWQQLRNTSGVPLELNLGYDRIGHWNFSLRRPSGSVQRARPTVRFTPSFGSRVDKVVVAPNATYVQAVVLDEWLRFDEAGKYVLTLESTNSIGSGSSRVRIDPVEHDIVVRPRDVEALRRRCSELIEMLPLARTVSDPEATRTAASSELLWFRDPSSVPCIERAIEVAEIPNFIDVLVAIGTVEARDAIVRLTKHRLDYIAQGAKNALARFRLK